MTIDFNLGNWRIVHPGLAQNHYIPYIELNSDLLTYLYWAHAVPFESNEPPLSAMADQATLKIENPISGFAYTKLPYGFLPTMESFLSNTKIWPEPLYDKYLFKLNPPKGLPLKNFLEKISTTYQLINDEQVRQDAGIGRITDPYNRLLEVKSWKDYLIYAELSMFEAILISWLSHYGYHEHLEFTYAPNHSKGVLANCHSILKMIPYDQLGRAGLPLTKARTQNSRLFWRSTMHLRQIGILESVMSMTMTSGRLLSYLCLTPIGIAFAQELTDRLNKLSSKNLAS